jgi:glutamine synthetase
LEAFDSLDDKSVIEAFENVKVLSKTEIMLRKSVMVEKYLETVILEAKTIVEMFNKSIFNCFEEFIYSQKQIEGRKELIKLFESAKNTLTKEVVKLSDLIEETKSSENISGLVRDKILVTMKTIRNEYDKIEPLIPDKFMPFPNYNKILY